MNNTNTISSIRFHKTRGGSFVGEVTVTVDGVKSYPRVANLAEALDMAKSAGAEVRGTERVIKLTNESAIADNGGSNIAKIVDFFTTPVVMKIAMVGDFVRVDEVTGTAGTTAADNSNIAKLIADVTVTAAPAKATKPAEADAEDLSI